MKWPNRKDSTLDALSKYLGEWQKLNAWWEHSGEPDAPHVILSAGDHSTVFMNNGVIAQQDAPLFLKMMRDLVGQHPSLIWGEDLAEVDFIVAPAMGGVQMAIVLALAIHSMHGIKVAQYYSEKIEDPVTKKVIGMKFTRGGPQKGQRGLVFDDVTTSLNALLLCAKAVTDADAEVIGLGSILNRSPFETVGIGGKKLPIHCLVRKDIRNHKPEECPLCQAGSKAFRPKELWSELTKR